MAADQALGVRRERQHVPSRRRLLIAAAVVFVAAGTVVALAGRDGRRSEAAPDGARLLADEVGERFVAVKDIGPNPLEQSTLDQLSMGAALLIYPRGEGSFFVLVWNTLVTGTDEGEAVEVGLTDDRLLAGLPTAFNNDGDSAFAFRPEGSDAPTGGSTVVVHPYGTFHGDLELNAAFDVGAVAFSADGGVLVANRDASEIDVLGRPGANSRLLGATGDQEAAVGWDVPDGRIVALLALDGERVLFVLDTDVGERLFLLDGDGVEEVKTGPVNPVLGISRTEAVRGVELSPIFVPLSLSADGRVIAVGLAEDGHARISAVDVDSGKVEVLADLEEVEPSVAEPVSAVGVGDDLIFLAKDKLWRKADVL